MQIEEKKFSKKHSKLNIYHCERPNEKDLNRLIGLTRKTDTYYIIRFKNGIKIGISSSFGIRLKEYCKPWCFPIQEICVFSCKDIKHLTKELELMAKRRFCKLKISNSLEFTRAYSLSSIKKFSYKNFLQLVKKHDYRNYIKNCSKKLNFLSYEEDEF